MDIVQFIDTTRSALRGMAVFRASLGHGSILLIDVKSSDGSAPAYLRVECAWRIETPSHVLAASEDTRTTLATQVATLVGCTVRDVEISVPALEMRLVFNSWKQLTIFPVFADSKEYDNWTIHLADGQVLVAGPGAAIRSLKGDEPYNAM